MKPEITYVLKDECALDVLANLKDQTIKAWIFMHDNVIQKLKKTCDRGKCINSKYLCFEFFATDDYPATKILFSKSEKSSQWHEVIKIEADDIAFEQKASTPEEIFFLKLEE